MILRVAKLVSVGNMSLNNLQAKIDTFKKTLLYQIRVLMESKGQYLIFDTSSIEKRKFSNGESNMIVETNTEI
jgi:hypothetical protein